MKKAVLLVNTGSPRAPTPLAVYSYLTEFLTDPRVVDLPAWKRRALVHGVIVPFRFLSSAKAYKTIWTEEGSPLLFWSKRVQSLLQKELGSDTRVELAMRYGSPSIRGVMKRLEKEGVQELTVLPLFPQYTSATTGSVFEEVMRCLKSWTTMPNMHWVKNYPTDEKFIQAWASRGKQFDIESYDHVLFSYHGLPERQIQNADATGYCLTHNCCSRQKNPCCYSAQCYATTEQIRRELSIDPEKMSIAFQSRLGRDPWLQPYTAETLEKLAKQGKKRILVFSPAFVSDCLETLYEIGIEYQEEFKEWGGEQLDFVESLNDHPLWIESVKQLVLR